MAFGIRLLVTGDWACFTRPEMKAERVSYEVITPSAARGILDAIHWKPAIAWVIDRIHVLNPIRFQSFRRNEVGAKISAATAGRAMRAGNVADLGSGGGGQPPTARRNPAAARRLRDRGAFRPDRLAPAPRTPRPSTSPCSTAVPPPGSASTAPASARGSSRRTSTCCSPALPCRRALPPDQRDRDLGWMLHDIDFANGNTSRFFRARLADGVLDVQACLAEGVAS